MSLYLGDKLISGSFKSGASWEVGDVGISAFGIDEALNKRRYLNGQVISQAQFVEFTAMLKSRVSVYPSLATTEVNWQAEVTNSKLGQCGKFVIDDENGTIRLPKVVNIQGLIDLTGLGTTVEAGLPNITGDTGYYTGGVHTSGAFYKNINKNGNDYATAGTTSMLSFDASRSSSIYGNSTTVQPEAVQYPYFIQVAEGIENSVDVSREIELNNPFSLLQYMYSEYEISNASWLLSNGQYNSGATYPAVYDLLLQIYNGTVTKAGVSVKLSTETYDDYDFVLSTGDTTFRLPIKVKLPNSKGVAGNGMALGVTDGTNNAGVYFLPSGMAYEAPQTLVPRTDYYGSSVGTSARYNGETPLSSKIAGITTDATKSGIEVKDDSSIYLYFYVGETVQDANVIAAASVLTDMTNIKNGVGYSQTGKNTIVGWEMPDYTGAVRASFNSSYTAPTDGYIYLQQDDHYNAVFKAFINGSEVWYDENANSYFERCCFIPVSKDDIITATGADYYTFYPCKGAN